MEHKSWPWKKKSTEKLMITADKVNRGNEDEANLADKMELQRNLNILDEKLSAALAEINAKDEIAKKQTHIAREAIQGWEKAELEVLTVKQELEKATQQKVADEERLNSADSALTECMSQLRFICEEQEKRVHEAVTKTSKEHEKRITVLEEKLAESNDLLSKLSLENTQLTATLSVNEKIIDELNSIRAQLDYDLRNVVSQLESTQRENASLSYEIRVLEKELEIRNEEREFNRRTSDVAHKQYLVSVKKIAKLETEAQRLRLLVQKRLPGAADVAKMKNSTENVTRRRSNPFPVVSKSNDYIIDDDKSSKKISFLTQQLLAFEEENKLLKEFLNQKSIELSKSQTSEMGSDEKVSMAESWAPSCFGGSDISLMDDFLEQEKLALITVDKPFANSSIVQENHINWIDNILKVVAEHAKIMQKSSIDMLDDVKVALLGKNNCNVDENMSKLMQKLVDLIQGIRLSDLGYTVHTFQWKTSEIRAILEEFIQICNELVNGKIGVDSFVKELTFSLEWIVNHCFSLQDVSSMKDEIKKHFECDENETRSESEIDGGPTGQVSEVDKLTFPKDQLPGWPMASISNKIFHLEPNVGEKVGKLKDDVAKAELVDKDLECEVQSESDKCQSLIGRIQESEKDIGSQEKEVDIIVKECNDDHKESVSIEEQVNNISNKEELNNDDHQPESLKENEMKICDMDNDGTTLPSEQEITAASEKLAKCQETVLNLGKQLKAMASLPIETSSSNKCEITVSPLPTETNNERISLLDKMITEDATGAPRGQKTKGVTRNLTSPAVLEGNSNPTVVMSPRMFVSVDGVRDEKDEEALVNFLSIVPNKKKHSGGILKRLFWRKNKSGNK